MVSPSTRTSGSDCKRSSARCCMALSIGHLDGVMCRSQGLQLLFYRFAVGLDVCGGGWRRGVGLGRGAPCDTASISMQT